jgi:hypothetical protein
MVASRVEEQRVGVAEQRAREGEGLFVGVGRAEQLG